MSTAELVNLIQKHFGKREFKECDNRKVHVMIGPSEYRVDGDLKVYEIFRKEGFHSVTHGSEWIRGILQGKTRNERGELG